MGSALESDTAIFLATSFARFRGGSALAITLIAVLHAAFSLDRRAHRPRLFTVIVALTDGLALARALIHAVAMHFVAVARAKAKLLALVFKTKVATP